MNSTAGSRAALSVRYDAATLSYTIETAGRSSTFAPADTQPQRIAGETSYAKGGAMSDYLTLVTTPYYGSTSNRYVGLGYWQQNSVASGIQSTQFSTFAYGLDTPGTAVPRTGGAHWDTDIFGLLTAPGIQIRTIQGRGVFDVDFAGGVFSAFANVDEFDYITGGGRVGSLRFQGGGQLTSANGFSGNFSYNNNTTLLGGTLGGKFYGPGAEEMGASFDARGGNAVLTGAMTGQRGTGPVATLNLLNVTHDERLKSYAAYFYTQARQGEPGFSDVKAGAGDAFVTITPNGPGELSVDSYAYRPAAGDLVANGRANFITYQGLLAGRPLTVEYYKPGNANSELALTYASFATWSTKTTETLASGQDITNTDIRYVLYGLETPRDLLVGRTGTGTYTGLVYGSGASREGARYEVGGTSRFDVDFSAARYSGALNLNGKAADGTTTNFGSFAFASTLGFGQLSRASFDNGANANPFHTIQPYFFGTDGQEIGATFHLATGPESDVRTVLISGVAVAKRQ